MGSNLPKLEIRKYKGDDSTLIQRCRTVAEHFKKYKAQFIAFDVAFDDPFYDNWQAQILECESHPTDEMVDDDLRQHTQDADKARDNCFTAANGLVYYVKKAFPDDLRILQEFGFTERKLARAKNLNTVVWLTVMRKMANIYDAELTAANMPPAILTDIETARDAYAEKEIEQEIFKRKAIGFTRLRIKKFNKLYHYLHQVHQAAQVVFVKDEERRALFDYE
jgi:hypothetical protein